MSSDSARWCAICQAWGTHHTDRHTEEDDRMSERLPDTVEFYERTVRELKARIEELEDGIRNHKHAASVGAVGYHDQNLWSLLPEENDRG